MNETQIKWIITTVADFIMDEASQLKNNFTIKAFSTDINATIIIDLANNGNRVQFIVLDWYKQETRPECYGVNFYNPDEFEDRERIRLNCDLIKLNEIGYIDYFPDEKLKSLLCEYFSLT